MILKQRFSWRFRYGLNGEEVRKVSYTDSNDFKDQIKTVIKELRAEKIELRDVVFLSPRKYANSLVSKIGFEVNEFGNHFDPASLLPRFAPIQGFKGLDSKIVILVDVDNIREESFSQYIYSGNQSQNASVCHWFQRILE